MPLSQCVCHAIDTHICNFHTSFLYFRNNVVTNERSHHKIELLNALDCFCLDFDREIEKKGEKKFFSHGTYHLATLAYG